MVTLVLLVVRDDVIALAMFSVALRSRVAGPYIQQEGMQRTMFIYVCVPNSTRTCNIIHCIL